MTTKMISQKIPDFIKIIKESNDRLAVCALVQTKMMESLKEKEVENIHCQFKTLNSRIKEEMPELARILEDGRKPGQNGCQLTQNGLRKRENVVTTKPKKKR